MTSKTLNAANPPPIVLAGRQHKFWNELLVNEPKAKPEPVLEEKVKRLPKKQLDEIKKSLEGAKVFSMFGMGNGAATGEINRAPLMAFKSISKDFGKLNSKDVKEIMKAALISENGGVRGAALLAMPLLPNEVWPVSDINSIMKALENSSLTSKQIDSLRNGSWTWWLKAKAAALYPLNRFTQLISPNGFGGILARVACFNIVGYILEYAMPPVARLINPDLTPEAAKILGTVSYAIGVFGTMFITFYMRLHPEKIEKKWENAAEAAGWAAVLAEMKKRAGNGTNGGDGNG